MKRLIFILIFLFSGYTLRGQTTGNTIFRFLELSPNAYAAALGGNQAGLYDADFSLYHINPAYLSHSPDRMASISFINYLSDSKMGFANAVWKLDEKQHVGFGLRFLNYGDFNTLDEDGNNLGDFTALDVAMGFVYSTLISPQWSIGGSLDLIHASYYSYQSNAVAFSGGLYFKNPEEQLSAGFSIRNLGTQLSTFNGTREPLPLDVSIGLTKKPEAFFAELSLGLRRLNDWKLQAVGETSQPKIMENLLRHFIAGGEIDMGENFRVRVGYNHYMHEYNKTKDNFDLAGTSIGVGFNIKDLIFDISRNSYSESGGVVQLSIKTAI